jgi:hypothetical protein
MPMRRRARWFSGSYGAFSGTDRGHPRGLSGWRESTKTAILGIDRSMKKVRLDALGRVAAAALAGAALLPEPTQAQQQPPRRPHPPHGAGEAAGPAAPPTERRATLRLSATLAANDQQPVPRASSGVSLRRAPSRRIAQARGAIGGRDPDAAAPAALSSRLAALPGHAPRRHRGQCSSGSF